MAASREAVLIGKPRRRQPTAIAPDRDLIAGFVAVIFGPIMAAGLQGYACLRAFPEKGSDGSGWLFKDVRLDGPSDLPKLVEAAFKMAVEAQRRRFVFCPPPALFGERFKTSKAGERHIATDEGNVIATCALATDLDKVRPSTAIAAIEAKMGCPPSLVMESGGTWPDDGKPDDGGEPEPKAHGYWLTAEPIIDRVELVEAKRCRVAMVKLAGGDYSGAPLVHPLRWPGSVHMKGEARLMTLRHADPSARIANVAECLAKLTEGNGAISAEEGGPLDPLANGRVDDRKLRELIDAVLTGKDLHPVSPQAAVRMMMAAQESPTAAARLMLRELWLSAKRPDGEAAARLDNNELENVLKWAEGKVRKESSETLFAPIDFAAEPAHAETAEPKPAKKSRAAVWAHEIQPVTVGRWIVKKLIPSEGYGILYGKSQAGKTFVGIDLACRIAAGMEWNGRKTKPCTVVYLAAEAPTSVKNRVAGWRMHHGHEGPLRVLVIDPPFDLFSGTDDVAEVVNLVQEKVKEAGAEKPGIVFVDPLPNTFGGGSENRAEDMGKVTANLANISRALASIVIAVHHTGKDEDRGPRGSYALYAGAEVSIYVEEQEGGEGEPGLRTITFDKERDGKKEAFGFKLSTPLTLGLDEDDEPETTCVALEADLPEPARTADKARAAEMMKGLGVNQKLAFEVIASIAEWPDDQAAPVLPGGSFAVSEAACFAKFASDLGGQDAEHRVKNRWGEALAALLVRKIIARWEGDWLAVNGDALAWLRAAQRPSRRAK